MGRHSFVPNSASGISPGSSPGWDTIGQRGNVKVAPQSRTLVDRQFAFVAQLVPSEKQDRVCSRHSQPAGR
jgi:hypothetical protein